MARGRSRSTLVLIAALAATGCEEEGVRTYAVPKEAAGHRAHDGHDPGGGDAHSGPSAPGPETTAAWTLPAGWSVDAAPRTMRYATLRAGEDADALEVAISRFPGDVGGLEANVNRWREQLGLAPLAGPALAATLEPIDVEGRLAYLIDLRTPGGERRLLVALLPRPDETWFVKTSAPAARVAPEEARFRQLVLSLRFGGTDG